MRIPTPFYGIYERQLARSLPADALPRHIGVILDGNRRWARSFGESTPPRPHRPRCRSRMSRRLRPSPMRPHPRRRPQMTTRTMCR